MGKEKKQQVMVLALLGVFAVVLMSSLKSLGVFGRKPQPATPVTAASQTSDQRADAVTQGAGEVDLETVLEGEPASAEGNGIPMPTIQYAADVTRDPLMAAFHVQNHTTPAEPAEGTSPDADSVPDVAPRRGLGPPSIAIEGLIWRGRNPLVIIDGKIYQLGDMIGQSRIVAIDRDGLTVDLWGARFRTAMRKGPDSRGVNGWEPVEPPRTVTSMAKPGDGMGLSRVGETPERGSAWMEGD